LLEGIDKMTPTQSGRFERLMLKRDTRATEKFIDIVFDQCEKDASQLSEGASEQIRLLRDTLKQNLSEGHAITFAMVTQQADDKLNSLAHVNLVPTASLSQGECLISSCAISAKGLLFKSPSEIETHRAYCEEIKQRGLEKKVFSAQTGNVARSQSRGDYVGALDFDHQNVEFILTEVLSASEFDRPVAVHEFRHGEGQFSKVAVARYNTHKSGEQLNVFIHHQNGHFVPLLPKNVAYQKQIDLFKEDSDRIKAQNEGLTMAELARHDVGTFEIDHPHQNRVGAPVRPLATSTTKTPRSDNTWWLWRMLCLA